MKTTFAMALTLVLALTGCGPMGDPDALPAVDEARCTKEALEPGVIHPRD